MAMSVLSTSNGQKYSKYLHLPSCCRTESVEDFTENEKLFRLISHIIESEGKWISELTEIDS